jgi:DNA-binding Xre family transcriptional regulator
MQNEVRFRVKLRGLMLKFAAERGEPLTQVDLARETGIGRPAVNRWYQGDVERIEARPLLAFMRYFNCSLTDLVEIVEVKELSESDPA